MNNKYEFNWSEFAKSDFLILKYRVETDSLVPDQWYGNVRVGDLSFELNTREIEVNKIAVFGILYVGGVEGDGPSYFICCDGYPYAEVGSYEIHQNSKEATTL